MYTAKPSIQIPFIISSFRGIGFMVFMVWSLAVSIGSEDIISIAYEIGFNY
jgi:hypothetical protein